jgi:hypothetical protein
MGTVPGEGRLRASTESQAIHHFETVAKIHIGPYSKTMVMLIQNACM